MTKRKKILLGIGIVALACCPFVIWDVMNTIYIFQEFEKSREEMDRMKGMSDKELKEYVETERKKFFELEPKKK